MKKRQKPLTDEQWELIEPLLPPLTQRRDKRGPKASPEPGSFRGHFVDSANGCGMAFSAGRVSRALNLLEATASMGGRRRQVRRDLLGRELHPGKKGVRL